MILAFHKPYGVLCQFTQREPHHRTLAEYGFPKGVYPIGRLDWDSEGLLLLSDEKRWNDYLLNPRHAHVRVYHAQVEGIATAEAMQRLEQGVVIQGYRTRPCKATLLTDPGYPPRTPPIRHRLSVPTSWIQLELTEGKNRQVRRMTAVAGFPTLRLLRVAIAKVHLQNIPPGKWVEISPNLLLIN
ncbi:MAG: pseudouridine synthase [Candidatus Omnitrophota bacterium]